jgi:hypothetical protein
MGLAVDEDWSAREPAGDAAVEMEIRAESVEAWVEAKWA